MFRQKSDYSGGGGDRTDHDGAPAYALMRKGERAKGDVLGAARLAGIMATKKVDQLIPRRTP